MSKTRSDSSTLDQASRVLYEAVESLDATIAKTLSLNQNDLKCLNKLEEGPLSPSQIGSSLGLTSGAMTALLDRLEKLGFIERIRNPKDRRSINVKIEARAFKKIAPLYKIVAQTIQKNFSGMTESQEKEVVDILNKYASACKDARYKIQESFENM